MKEFFVNILIKPALRILNPKTRTYRKFNISRTEEKIYKHTTKRKRFIHRYRDDVKVVFYNPLEFLHAIKEIFVDEVYLFKTNSKRPYIIDCGGYIGLSALFFRLKYPDAEILVYEADPQNYAIAKENIDSWKTLKNIELFNKAIWINEDPIQFTETNDMSSSIVKEELANSTGGKIIQVQTQRLKDLINRKVDFLKIDIEGAEYEVMVDIDAQLCYVDNLFVEYHGFYHEMHKLNTIFSILEKNGFQYYIKEAANVYSRPFYDKVKEAGYDVQLNIFAFKD